MPQHLGCRETEIRFWAFRLGDKTSDPFLIGFCLNAAALAPCKVEKLFSQSCRESPSPAILTSSLLLSLSLMPSDAIACSRASKMCQAAV